MRIDHLVDLAHQARHLLERDDDALVAGDVLGRDDATPLLPGRAAVVEPLAEDLIAAELKVAGGDV